MRNVFFPLFLITLFLAAGYAIYTFSSSMERKAQAQNTTLEEDESPANHKLRVYSVPSSFRTGYVTILSRFITSTDELRYPDEIPVEEVIASATEPTEEANGNQSDAPFASVQYDPKKNLLVVLAADEEHKQIQAFLDQLEDTKVSHTPVMYRLAYVERDIHPKLKDYPFEFEIDGHCWDKGRTSSKYPKWLVDYSKRFPDILFTEVDVDRHDHKTKFDVEGFARTRKDAERITEYVRRAKHTDSDTEIKEHDFMAESRENLNRVLGDIFPNTKLDGIIRSLQHTEVYQVETEAVLASESAVPGFFRTALGDEYFVEVECEEGIGQDGKYRVDIHVYKKRDHDDKPFDGKNLHLSTSLITSFGQINMLGIRHHDDRYVLLFSMEPAGRQ